MKAHSPKRRLETMLIILMATITFTSCKDEDEKPKTVPEVSTSIVINITTNSATGGGEIVSNGNSDISVSGLAYSSTNTTPTISDEKIALETTEGSFTSDITNLSSNTIYYIRAYATNSVGTGYGDIVEFTTNNAAPTATSVIISGSAEVNKNLTATYTYNDAENDTETGSTYHWYIANDDAGTGEVLIGGATSLTYLLQDIDEFKYIRFAVTPKASAGNSLGVEVKSPYVGPIAVRTTITFLYNGEEVTYGIITSPLTGRKWLDRNLGAPNTPSAWNDYANFGDLFQFGRAADGHQLLNRIATPEDPTTGTTNPINGNTTTLSSTDTPSGGLYILSPTTPFDWRSPTNVDLWRGQNLLNNPCPSGWHIPDSTEWRAENIQNVMDGYPKLKITAGGFRTQTGTFSFITSRGAYWSSTLRSSNSRPYAFEYTDTGLTIGSLGSIRGGGRSCRCIKNQ